MTAIDDEYASLGGAAGFLGPPIAPEADCADRVGRFRLYANGAIYWSPSTKAHEVHGDILKLWASLGSEESALGYPTSGEKQLRLARVSHFEHGSIYWDSRRGAYEVFTRRFYPRMEPALVGSWEVPEYTSGVVGTHAALLRDGKVLFFAYKEGEDHLHDHSGEPPPDGESAVLDLAFATISAPFYFGPGHDLTMPNIFCSGHAFLADGRLLVAGGDREAQERIRSLHVFTPEGGGDWRYVGRCAEGRWYATCVTLPDGRVLIVGGEKRIKDLAAEANRNTTFEIYDPDKNRVSAPIAQPEMTHVGSGIDYPFVFVLPQRKLVVHGGTTTLFFNFPKLTFERTLEATARPNSNSRTYPLEGTSVLLPLDPDTTPPYRARIMMIGGGGPDEVEIRTPATATCEILDTSAPFPAWRLAAPLRYARVMPDAVLLPDETVMVMSGSSRGYADNAANPVWDAEIYNPALGRWSLVDRAEVPRLYHATALLLPDARVMTAGTDSLWNPDPFHRPETRLEIFSPPYLFAGPRPVLAAAPTEIVHGRNFKVMTPTAPTVTSATLLRCGSSTHSFNPDQRCIRLRIVKRTLTELELEAPPDGYVAPPGYYLLFLLQKGVPSHARYVRVRGG